MTSNSNSARPNPLYAGPRPPFKNQRQKGKTESTDELDPAADHGENSYVGTGRLKGCKALIVGGDSGIGRAISLAYAREGADVALTYHSNEDDASTTANLLEKEAVRYRIYQLDQTDAGACRETIDQVVDDFGRLDILVNNAAFQKTYEKLSDIKIDEFELTFRTNVFGTFYLCSAAVDHIAEGGCIINSASIQAFDPSAALLPYAASKAAIANMTKSLASLAIGKGIRINAVAPGPVWTPLIPSTMSPDKVENFGANTMFGRPAQPVELVGAYVFLASADASYVTGEIYPVTGGRCQL